MKVVYLDPGDRSCNPVPSGVTLERLQRTEYRCRESLWQTQAIVIARILCACAIVDLAMTAAGQLAPGISAAVGEDSSRQNVYTLSCAVNVMTYESFLRAYVHWAEEVIVAQP
jgi:hypothetical protein